MLPVTFEPAVDIEPPSPESVPEIRPEPVQDPLPMASEDREVIQPDVLLRETVIEYFEAWEEGDIPKILSFYINSSETVVEWKGTVPFVWGSSYPGYDKVRQLTEAFRPLIVEMHAVFSNYIATFDGNKAIVTGTLYSTAQGKLAGKFFIEVDIETEWENTDEGWKISRDEWDFVRVAAERPIAHAWP